MIVRRVIAGMAELWVLVSAILMMYHEILDWSLVMIVAYGFLTRLASLEMTWREGQHLRGWK